jgi:hypothetical protein
MFDKFSIVESTSPIFGNVLTLKIYVEVNKSFH